MFSFWRSILNELYEILAILFSTHFPVFPSSSRAPHFGHYQDRLALKFHVPHLRLSPDPAVPHWRRRFEEDARYFFPLTIYSVVLSRGRLLSYSFTQALFLCFPHLLYSAPFTPTILHPRNEGTRHPQVLTLLIPLTMIPASHLHLSHPSSE